MFFFVHPLETLTFYGTLVRKTGLFFLSLQQLFFRAADRANCLLNKCLSRLMIGLIVCVCSSVCNKMVLSVMTITENHIFEGQNHI